MPHSPNREKNKNKSEQAEMGRVKEDLVKAQAEIANLNEILTQERGTMKDIQEENKKLLLQLSEAKSKELSTQWKSFTRGIVGLQKEQEDDEVKGWDFC